MKRGRWQIFFGIILIILSILTYFIHFFIFRDPHHILIYLIGDIAFVFIEVLLVTLVLHELLQLRDRRSRMKKLNMLIGTFFSEIGTELLRYFSDIDPSIEQIRNYLLIDASWNANQLQKVSKKLRKHDYSVEFKRADLEKMKNFLLSKRAFLVRLLENPSVLEHENFTTLLQAVFHLTEELDHRKTLSTLPDKDERHLSGDIKRAYDQLVFQWLNYMWYLQKHYPYLFSLAMRTNPFDKKASVIVQ